MTKSDADIQAVVFDMGGVLVELGPLSDILGNDPLPESDFWRNWLASPIVRKFEMGLCSPEEFGSRLVEEFGLACTGEQLVQRFLAWPKGLFPGAEALVGSLASGLEVAVLSNTNALHWEGQADAELMRRLFSRFYLSFQLGLAKPDAEIFQHVISDLGFAPKQVVFLDDNKPNVDAAASLGIDAVLVKGVTQARAALLERNLLG